MISKRIIDWLIEHENSSVRYRTMVEILDKSQKDSEVLETKNLIINSIPVKVILNKMHPDGYWLQKNPRTREVLGKGIKYGAFGTTHYCLSYLAELGLGKDHPKIALASKRYLSLQKGMEISTAISHVC